MTEGSKWRTELARKIAPFYAENQKVRAVIIGGSVSRGIADRYSDVEIGVFWAHPPTEAERQTVVDRIGVLGQKLEPYSMDPDDPGSYGADEDIYIGGDRRTGFQVDVKHTVIKEIESILDKPGVGEREVIYNAIPLYGHDLVEDWKARLAPDTEEQAREAVSKTLRFGPWWMWEQFVEEDEAMWAINGLNWLLMGLSWSLASFNRVHVNTAKWPAWSFEQMQDLPEDFWPRVKDSIRQKPDEALQAFRILTEETLHLVETHMPEIDMDQVRSQTFPPKPSWLVRSQVQIQDLLPWQQALLKNIIQAYTTEGDIQAILLSGDISMGRMETDAALECHVFWSDVPSDVHRRRACSHLSTNLLEFEDYDQETSVGKEIIDIEGLRIYIRHMGIGNLEAIIRDVLENHTPEISNQMLLGTIKYGTSLFGKEIIQQWKKRLESYPEVLVQNTIRMLLDKIKWPWSNRIDIYGYREAYMFYFALFIHQAQYLLYVLMALNKRYAFNNGDPLNCHIHAFEMAPENFAERFNNMFRHPPLEAVEEIRQLIEDMFTLLEQHLPEVDISEAREAFRRERRKGWDQPPAF